MNINLRAIFIVNIEEVNPGEFRGVVEDFATGFASAIDVAIDIQGRLCVADFSSGQVYQISWTDTDG